MLFALINIVFLLAILAMVITVLHSLREFMAIQEKNGKILEALYKKINTSGYKNGETLDKIAASLDSGSEK